jgi:hypothetical protein
LKFGLVASGSCDFFLFMMLDFISGKQSIASRAPLSVMLERKMVICNYKIGFEKYFKFFA